MNKLTLLPKNEIKPLEKGIEKKFKWSLWSGWGMCELKQIWYTIKKCKESRNVLFISSGSINIVCSVKMGEL